MTFDQSLDALWREFPGWTFVLRSSGDNAAFKARIKTPDYLVEEWTAGDETRSSVVAGRAIESDWCGSPAGAILEAAERARLDDVQNAVRVAKQAVGDE